MSDALSAGDRELETQLQILQDNAATLHREVTELLTSPRMITILVKQRTQKILRWFQNRKARYHPRTMKRIPSPRCASAIQIVRPSESKADTQPTRNPAF